MYTEPQTLTINAVPVSLPRVGVGIGVGSFSKDDGTVKLGVSHAYGKRTRRQFRVDHSKVAPDPLISSTNILYSMSAYMVVDVPKTGYTIVEQKQLVDAILAWASAASGANITKLLGGEV